jgi:hypothetical protein
MSETRNPPGSQWKCGSAGGSALLGSYYIERSYFLFHILTSAMRAHGVVIVVIAQRQIGFEGFLAIVADIIINGHKGLLADAGSWTRGDREILVPGATGERLFYADEETAKKRAARKEGGRSCWS